MTETSPLRFASRVSQISPSPTMAVMAEAMRLRAEGEDVVDFSAGQPDFPTPAHIKKAGEDAIAQDFTRYTANPGMPELRQAVADRYREDYGLAFDGANVIITSGGKHALLDLVLTLVDAGDEVVIPTPYWMTARARFLALPQYLAVSRHNVHYFDPTRSRVLLSLDFLKQEGVKK